MMQMHVNILIKLSHQFISMQEMIYKLHQDIWK